MSPLILGIESSCDETAAAVLRDGRHILSNVVASQVAIHKRYGGVVPELASRHHLENITFVVRTSLEAAGILQEDLHSIAVTQGPGLVGSLLVGINYAKALSFALKIPLVAVNHLEGHIYSVPLQIANNALKHQLPGTEWDYLYPSLVLVVSGGHTSLFQVERLRQDGQSHGIYRLIGRTRDDAAGEAFDKVAKWLGLGYPGGPVIDKLARNGNPDAVSFSIARISDGRLDFSFSGIKTAVLRHVKSYLSAELEEIRAHHKDSHFFERLPQSVYDLISSFQNTVVEMLLSRTLHAAAIFRPRTIMVVGGVACNSWLRARFEDAFRKQGLPVYFPSPDLSTDNAAMIAAAGFPKWLAGEFADMSLNADVHLKLGTPAVMPWPLTKP
jgi:N6-L-threonylcarbamoyladenine synthase